MECGNHEENAHEQGKGKKNRPKTKLGIPDLEHSNAAVLRSLGSPDSRRGYLRKILIHGARAVVLRIKRDRAPIGVSLDALVQLPKPFFEES